MVRNVFWLEDDWHNCEFELAYCAMYEIEVERCSSVRDALMRLSKPDWTSQFFRFVFDVNLQVDDTDLEIFPKPIDLTRDLVGLAQIDEDGVTSMLRPARGRRHLVQALRNLSAAADLQPRSNPVTLERLVPLGYALAQDVYPELVHPEVNAFPAWIPWLYPQPAYTLPRPLPPGRSWPIRSLTGLACWRSPPRYAMLFAYV